MFHDTNAWPPPPDGWEPAPPPRSVGPREERIIARLVALFLIALFAAPFCGSSVVSAVVALFR